MSLEYTGWVSITKGELASTLSGAEIHNIESVALRDGQEDPIEQAIAGVIGLVRGYVSGNPANRLGEGATVPARLRDITLDIITHRVLTRVKLNPSNARQGRYDDALKILDKVSTGSIAISDPETEEADPNEYPSRSYVTIKAGKVSSDTNGLL